MARYATPYELAEHFLRERDSVTVTLKQGRWLKSLVAQQVRDRNGYDLAKPDNRDQPGELWKAREGEGECLKFATWPNGCVRIWKKDRGFAS